MNEKMLNNRNEYYRHSIKTDLKFKNRVLEYKIDKYKQIIAILFEYADGCWLFKNNYGEQYGEDEEHNDEEYVSEEVRVDELYDDISKYEEKLLDFQLKEMIKKQELFDDKNKKRREMIRIKGKLV